MNNKLLLVTLLTVSSFTFADAKLSKVEENVAWMIEQTLSKETCDGISNMFDNSPMFAGLTEEQVKTVKEISKKSMEKVSKWFKDNTAELTKVYLKQFTADDIQKMVDFYQTDLGKKLLEKMGPLMADIGQMYQPVMMECMTEMQTEMMKVMPQPQAPAQK